MIIMKTFIQFNQLSYYTNRELGNVRRRKTNNNNNDNNRMIIIIIII